MLFTWAAMLRCKSSKAPSAFTVLVGSTVTEANGDGSTTTLGKMVWCHDAQEFLSLWDSAEARELQVRTHLIKTVRQLSSSMFRTLPGTVGLNEVYKVTSISMFMVVYLVSVDDSLDRRCAWQRIKPLLAEIPVAHHTARGYL